MAKGGPKGSASIQKLLDERAQIQRWLDRLGMAADAAPENVRHKVQKDYERRLGEITEELQGHGEEVEEALEKHRTAQEELSKQEAEAAERLEEAELRHAVGEYDEGQWSTVRADMMESLLKAREELKRANQEIARLEEVVTLISGEPEPAPPEAKPEAKEEPPPAPPPVPETKGKEPAKKPPAKKEQPSLDELAFLRSVTEDEAHGPAPSRASGAMKAIPEPPPAGIGPPPSSGSTEFRDPEHKKDTLPRASRSLRSLKCGECGTMNLPTEWYCERCGAELAAL